MDSGNTKEHLKDWWKPILEMKFDNPQQESPFWVGSNNVILRTPFEGILIKAFSAVTRHEVGVFVSGVRHASVFAIQAPLSRERKEILKLLPPGTKINTGEKWPIQTRCDDIESDSEKYSWVIETLNTYVNVLRPKLTIWRRESENRDRLYSGS